MLQRMTDFCNYSQEIQEGNLFDTRLVKLLFLIFNHSKIRLDNNYTSGFNNNFSLISIGFIQ